MMVVGLSLVLGGAIGNLMDRVFRAPGFLKGAVVDFVHVGRFPTFNVADSAITIGAVLIVIWAVRTDIVEQRGRRDVAEEFVVPDGAGGGAARPRGGAAHRLDSERGAGPGRGGRRAGRRRAAWRRAAVSRPTR